MDAGLDPFSHHPELRDEIADPLQSQYRTFSIAKLEAKSKEWGLSAKWWYSDEEREAMRAETLAACRDNDLWIFAYGSLMWDPAFRFAEVRRAQVPDYARRFILKDIHGGRGTVDAPGLMAALDKGCGCDGLAFRILREHVEAETEILWLREKIGPAYTPTFVKTVVGDMSVRALTFVADYDAELIAPNLTRAEQIHFFATGKGFFGPSIDYLRNIAKKFAALDIDDEEVVSLLRETETYIASR